MTYSGVGRSKHAERLGILPSAGRAGLPGHQYWANHAIRVEGPFRLSGWQRLEERVTAVIDLAAMVEVNMKDLSRYLMPGNLGYLGFLMAIAAIRRAALYTAQLAKSRWGAGYHHPQGLEAALEPVTTQPTATTARQ